MRTTEALAELKEEDRRLFLAIRDVTIAIGTTCLDVRPTVMKEHGISEAAALLAIHLAFVLNTLFSAKRMRGESFDDCQDLNSKILEIIKTESSKCRGETDGTSRKDDIVVKLSDEDVALFKEWQRQHNQHKNN